MAFTEQGLRACGSGKSFGVLGSNSAAVRDGGFLNLEAFGAGFFRVIVADAVKPKKS
jgi:hypothetical protein